MVVGVARCGAILVASVLAATACAGAEGGRMFVASEYGGSLAAALAAIGDQPGTLVVDTALTCDAPAVPAHVDVTVPRGGLIMLPEAPPQVLGTLSAGRYPIFSPTGAVTGLKDPCPEWFGASGRGEADDTAAVQRAIDSVGDRQGSRLILGGKYSVTSLLVTHFGFAINSENAWLVARPGKADYLLRFAPSAHSATITGKLFIDLDYNLGYECAINVNARHFIAKNVEIWRAPLAWLFGDRKWATSGIPGDAERGDSEIEIIGAATPHCLRAVEAVGANTIIKFTGAFLYSFPWTLPEGDPRKAEWEAADCTDIRAIGGLIYVDSGGIANFNTKPMIDVQPIQTTDPAYFSEYGKVYVNSAHVESGNFFAATNPRGIVSGGRSNSLAMIGCNGYLSSDNPVITTDPLFTGGILIDDCGFYRAGRKSELAVIGNAQATVSIDPASFFDDSAKGLNAVRGGTQRFVDRLVLHVEGAAQTIPAEGDTVRFLRVQSIPDGAAFESCYDPATGAFTCPYGGLSKVTVRAVVATVEGEPTDTSEVHIIVNGESVFHRKVAGYGAEIEYTIPELHEGDTVAVRMHASEPRTSEDGVATYLQVEASRW